jgi:hypothetical protein
MAFQIPAKLDRHLAALSKVYGKEGKRTKQEILVNAQAESMKDGRMTAGTVVFMVTHSFYICQNTYF